MMKKILNRINHKRSFKKKGNKKYLVLLKHLMSNVKEKNTLIVLGNKKGKFCTYYYRSNLLCFRDEHFKAKRSNMVADQNIQ